MGRASRGKRRPEALYHFTSQFHLPKILDDGFLKTTESNVSFRRPHAGPDVVWLVDLPVTEVGQHGLDNSYGQLPNGERIAVDKRAVRFTVDTRLVKAEAWTDWIKRHPYDWKQADPIHLGRDAFLETAGGPEAAAHWFVTEAIIPVDAWRSIAMKEDDGSYRVIWKLERVAP